MLEVADIFGRYGQAYLRRFGDTMPASHRRAFQAILDCRTAALGGHLYRCDHCGRQHYSYHSCRNRNCPKCHRNETQSWLEERRRELLPGTYFHVVFTLPQDLRRPVRSHQKELYGILMKSAARALIQLAADPKYVGGRIGMLAILHTSGRTLIYHPHVHCLVPGGGLSADGHWLTARQDYLVPVRALSRMFRGIFLDLARQQLPEVRLPQGLWKQEWVVYCKPSVQGVQNVLNYLGRYVHRVAIANSRIVSIDDGQVRFRYQKSGSSHWRTMTLDAQEFIRRFLQHVLPNRFHKVRYYGLWAPSNRRLLRRIQLLLRFDPSGQPTSEPAAEAPAQPQAPCPTAALAGQRCPYCHNGLLVWIRRLPPQPRIPP
ncbi:MAG: IS91 family transposase [Planctomycetota bacterium]|jgi:hypothetical protein